MVEFKLGDLVLAKVVGFPPWPGQVMPEDTARARVLALRKPNTILVSFFGDNSFGWFPKENLFLLEENKDLIVPTPNKLTQKIKTYLRAVEEATEVADRRAGREPATNHDPTDFLNPDHGLSDDSDEGAGERDTAVLAPPTAEDAASCTAESLHVWLCSVARNPAAMTQAEEDDSAQAGRRMLYAYRQSLLKAKSTPRKGPRPLGEGPDSAAGRSGGRGGGQGGRGRGRGRSGGRGTALVPAPTPARAHNKKRLPGSESEEEQEGEGATDRRQARDPLAGLEEEEEDEDEEEEEEEVAPKPKRRRAKKTVFAKNADNDVIIRLDLPALLGMLSALASDQAAAVQDDEATLPLALAMLRFREKVFARSALAMSMQGLGSVGVGQRLRDATDAALAAAVPEGSPADKLAVKGEKRKGGKPKMVLKVELPTLTDTALYKEYEDRLPDTAADFVAAMKALHAQHGTFFGGDPNLHKAPLDLYQLLRAVAKRGGYQAVVANKQWRVVGLEMRPDLAIPSVSYAIRTFYEKYLLAYEDSITQGAASHTIPVLKAEKKEVRDQAERRTVPRKEPKKRKAAEGGDGAHRRPRAGDKSSDAVQERHPAGVKRARAGSGGSKAREEPKRGGLSPSSPASAPPPRERVSPLEAKNKRELFSKMETVFGRPGAAPPGSERERLGKPLARAEERPSGPPRDTVVLHFPKGAILPTEAQVLAQARSFGEVQQCTVFRHSYTAIVRYTHMQYAAAAYKRFSETAWMRFNQRKDSIRVLLEVHRPPRSAAPHGAPTHHGAGGMQPYTASSQRQSTAAHPKMAGAQPQRAAAVDARRPPSAAAGPPPVDPRLQRHAGGPAPADPRMPPSSSIAAATAQQPPMDPRRAAAAAAPAPAPAPQVWGTLPSQAPVQYNQVPTHAAPAGSREASTCLQPIPGLPDNVDLMSILQSVGVPVPAASAPPAATAPNLSADGAEAPGPLPGGADISGQLLSLLGQLAHPGGPAQ